MTYEELVKAKEAHFLFDAVQDLELHEGKSCINGYIAIEIKQILPTYDVQENITIFSENNNEMGVICLGLQAGIYKTESNLTEFELVAYYYDIENEELAISAEQGYKFKKNYIVLEKEYYNDYLENYESTSWYWGSFITNLANELEPKKQETGVLYAVSKNKLCLPTDEHNEAASQSIISSYSLERCLKLYHLLELSFNHWLVEKIKGIDTDYREVDRLISEYNSNELSRLKKMISAECSAGSSEIAKKMNVFFSYNNIAKKLFYEYGKSSNPFDEKNMTKFSH